VIYTGPDEPNLCVVDVLVTDDGDPERFTVLVGRTALVRPHFPPIGGLADGVAAAELGAAIRTLHMVESGDRHVEISGGPLAGGVVAYLGAADGTLAGHTETTARQPARAKPDRPHGAAGGVGEVR
jgi:hypothetical protein